MSQPSQLTPADQDALVKQIGIALMRAAPQEWQQIRTEYRAAGRYYELTTEVVDEVGVASAWTASHDIAMLFAQLRAGMHSVRGGTWFNARYQIDRPSRYNLEFDREEPNWRTPPPLQAYRDELHFFPRSDDDVPEWLMRRLSGLRPEQPGRRFRVARIFDGRGPSGRPSVNRPPVAEEEKERLLDYLDRSPKVLPERGHDIDRLSADGAQTVPVAFHSDGVWVWPAAVNYYLRQYGLPPEPGLVEAARANDFRSPEIDEATANEAAATITGGRPAGPPLAQPGAPGQPPAPQQPMLAEPGGVEPLTRQDEQPAGPGSGAQPSQGQPSAGPAPAARHRPEAGGEDAEETIAVLRDKLVELGVPRDAYRIGTPEPNTWFLEQIEDGWQVGWYEHDFVAPMVFDEIDDAAAFLLGKLLLDADQQASRHEQAGRHDPGRHSDPSLGAQLSRPPESELDARPVPATPNEVEVDDAEPALRNGSGPHDDPGIRAAAASAGVDLGTHPFGETNGFGQGGFDQRRFEHDDYRDDDTEVESTPFQPTQFEPTQFEPAPFEPAPFEPARFGSAEYDRDQHDSGGFEAGGFEAGGFDAERFDTDGFDRDELPPGGQRNGNHQQNNPARFAATGLGGGPTDPATRAEALNTSTMVGASPVEAPPRRAEHRESRQARQDAPAGRSAANGEQQDSGTPQWEIQPLAGEPPLTLFRGKQMMRLNPGTEIDRFGDEAGNLTYDAGTPFEERSLVPEWVNRSYHVYEVTRPIEVLSGVAIPWFDQPGGGTAYLLPSSVDELLESGELVEIEVGARP